MARFTTDAPEESETLYMSRGRAYACIGGVSQLYESDEAAAAVLVSSEPLTDRSEWDAVPPNHLVVVGEDRHVELRPLQAS